MNSRVVDDEEDNYVDNHNLHVPILFSRQSHQIKYEEVIEEVFMIMPMRMMVKDGLLLILP